MSNIQFERNIAELEWKLSRVSAIPIVGLATGLFKTICGIIQTIGGILALLVSPFVKESKVFARRAASHIVNGFANTAAGTLDAVPVIGLILWLARYLKAMPGCGSDKTMLDTRQTHALLVGYRILEDNPTNKEKADLNSEGSYSRSPLLNV